MAIKRRFVVIGTCALAAIGAVAALFSYTYQQFDFGTMQSRTVVSDFDIPNAQLNVSQVGGLNRYEVSMPAQSPLSNGALLVQLVFGNPTAGTVTRVAYGTYGSEARIGGNHPLSGTGGVVLDEESAWVSGASASFGSNSLILDIDPSSLGGATLLHAEVYGTDAPLGLQPDDIPFWLNLPSKRLLDAFPDGGVILPSIPGAEEGGPFGGGGGGGAGSFATLLPPPQTPPRNITPPNWGPPPGVLAAQSPSSTSY